MQNNTLVVLQYIPVSDDIRKTCCAVSPEHRRSKALVWKVNVASLNVVYWIRLVDISTSPLPAGHVGATT